MAKKTDDNNGQQKAKRPAVDYASIEPAWRAGVKSVLQLAAEYEKRTGNPVSHTAIRKHFDKMGITRDLKDKVQAQARAKVSASAVSPKVSTETGTETTPTETAIIDANSDLVAGVLLSQRADIKRNRQLVMAMLGELEGVTFHGDTLEKMADILIGPIDPKDVGGKLRRQQMMDSINKAVGLNARIDSMKKLADTLKVLVALEREAYSIVAEPPKGDGGYEDLLDELAE